MNGSYRIMYRLIAPGYLSWTKQVKPFDLENRELEVSQIFDGVERHSTHMAQLVQRLYQRHFHDVQTVSMDQIASLQKTGSKGDPLVEYVYAILSRMLRMLVHTHV